MSDLSEAFGVLREACQRQAQEVITGGSHSHDLIGSHAVYARQAKIDQLYTLARMFEHAEGIALEGDPLETLCDCTHIKHARSKCPFRQGQ